MNFEELQMKRESCRVYADRPVTREQLVHLVDVARFAPSACNSQPWHFILVDEPESREKVVMTTALWVVPGEPASRPLS